LETTLAVNSRRFVELKRLLSKRQRLFEHLEYAEKHNVLEQVSAFIRELKEDNWFHIED